MSQPHFNSLPLSQQFDLLDEYGTYLGLCRYYQGYRIALFDFNGSYVEAWLNILHDKITRVEVVEDPALVDQYLEGVDISPLLMLP